MSRFRLNFCRVVFETEDIKYHSPTPLIMHLERRKAYEMLFVTIYKYSLKGGSGRMFELHFWREEVLS